MGVLESVHDATQVVLLPEVRVGRSPKSDLRLTDGDVSTEQAVILWTGDKWELRDAGSKNGTLLNGRVLRYGESATLDAGALVVFAAEQAYKVVDVGPPGFPYAIPLAGGGPIQAIDGVLSLPPEGPTEVEVRADGVQFVGKSDTAPIEDGEIVVAAERSYRILLSG